MLLEWGTSKLNNVILVDRGPPNSLARRLYNEWIRMTTEQEKEGGRSVEEDIEIDTDDVNEGQKDGTKNGQLGAPKDDHQTGQMLTTGKTILLDYREKIQVGLQEEKLGRREEQNLRQKNLANGIQSYIRLSTIIGL